MHLESLIVALFPLIVALASASPVPVPAISAIAVEPLQEPAPSLASGTVGIFAEPSSVGLDSHELSRKRDPKDEVEEHIDGRGCTPRAGGCI
ncbi:hypothetical protein L218DRAFT_968011 [Marasmius fiardii PR-910]|nr:hypothetical protein L218DRAFT_968011 [Marasmius fiardii PR-910]